MKLIVGLGNPGIKYLRTRHNFGFMVVEHFLKDFPGANMTSDWSKSAKLKSEVVNLEWQPKQGAPEKVILAKPQTYMNNSGMAVALLTSFYKVNPEDLWVVYDELDLPMGAMKIRFGGAAAGHHGVESIIESLATDKFWRFRMGIGADYHHSGQNAREEGRGHVIGRDYIKGATDYVLGTFATGDRGKARELLKRGSQALQVALEKGIEKAMNQFNTK